MQKLLRWIFRKVNAGGFLLGLVIILLLPIGCVPTSPAPTNNLATTSRSAAIPSVEPTILLTFTPSKTLLPTWTPSLSLTPLPTLSDSQADIQMGKWFQGTTDCLLPCWGGITPGKTTWEEAEQILSTVVDIKALDLNSICRFGSCNHIEWQKRGDIFVRGSITSNSDEVINSIRIEIQEAAPTYRTDRILEQYGSPEKVFIQTEYYGVMDLNNIYFALTLAYPSQNFIIQNIWMATRSGENTVGCLQEGSITLSISNLVNNQWSDDQLIENIYGVGDYDKRNIKPLEDVTNLTIGEFYEKFKSVDGDECIFTPGQYWP